MVECSNCKTENPNEAFQCLMCGSPLKSNNNLSKDEWIFIYTGFFSYSYTMHVDLDTNVYLSSINYFLKDLRAWGFCLISLLLGLFGPFLVYSYFVWKLQMMKFDLEKRVLDSKTYNKKLILFKTIFLSAIFFLISNSFGFIYYSIGTSSTTIHFNIIFYIDLLIFPQLIALNNYICSSFPVDLFPYSFQQGRKIFHIEIGLIFIFSLINILLIFINPYFSFDFIFAFFLLFLAVLCLIIIFYQFNLFGFFNQSAPQDLDEPSIVSNASKLKKTVL